MRPQGNASSCKCQKQISSKKYLAARYFFQQIVSSIVRNRFLAQVFLALYISTLDPIHPDDLAHNTPYGPTVPEYVIYISKTSFLLRILHDIANPNKRSEKQFTSILNFTFIPLQILLFSLSFQRRKLVDNVNQSNELNSHKNCFKHHSP